MESRAQTGADGRESVVTRHRGLVGRTALVSLLTLLSRILGFVREMISTAIFGDSSPVYDAFLTAWRVPNLFRRLLGEGALSTALQTSITEADADEGDEAGRSVFLGTLGLTSWILLAITVLGMLLISVLPDTLPFVGWHWLGADPGPVREFSLRLLPFVILVCLAALCGGALFVRGHFAIPNLAPAVMNMVWVLALFAIGGIYVWGEERPRGEPDFGTQREMARWIAWAVLGGGLLQLVLHVPPLVRHRLLPSPGHFLGEARRARGRAWSVLKTSLPLALGAAVYQINVMIDGLMAESLLENGGPTALYKANRIQQFPLALVAVATINAVFPSLKALGHLGRRNELRALYDRAQSGILFVGLPAAFGLFALSQPVCEVLFQRGNYGPEGVARMASALRMLALALLPAGAVGLIGRVYYAMGDFRTPVRVSIVMLVLNVALNVAFVLGLGLDAAGLALATAVTSWGSLALLVPGLTGRLALPATTTRPWARGAAMFAAALLSGASAWGVQRALAPDGGAPASPTSLALAIAAAVCVFVGVARWLRIPELDELGARLRRRLGRG